MAGKTGAGDLTERIAFDQPGEADDGAGGRTAAFVERSQAYAAYIHLRGGETVMAARLGGKHVQVIRVRASSQTRAVGTDWRIRDVRAGTIYDIQDITPSVDRMWIDFLCQSGAGS